MGEGENKEGGEKKRGKGVEIEKEGELGVERKDKKKNGRKREDAYGKENIRRG